jgi:Putative bacterial sensory transduction regulator
MQDLSYYNAMVEEIITSLGVDPALCRGQNSGQYSLMLGSARVWIDVWYIESQGRSYFQAMSPVMRLPIAASQLAFFQELLEINDKLYGVAFTVYNGWAWLKHIRETDGLDKSEAEAMIHRIGVYADQYDDHLKTKYGEAPISEGAAPGAPGQAV